MTFRAMPGKAKPMSRATPVQAVPSGMAPASHIVHVPNEQPNSFATPPYRVTSKTTQDRKFLYSFLKAK